MTATWGLVLLLVLQASRGRPQPPEPPAQKATPGRVLHLSFDDTPFLDD